MIGFSHQASSEFGVRKSLDPDLASARWGYRRQEITYPRTRLLRICKHFFQILIERFPNDPFLCDDAMNQGMRSHIEGGIKRF